MPTLTLDRPNPMRRWSDLPSPRGSLPWIGHGAQIRPLRLHEQMAQWGRELGYPYRLKLGPTRVVVLDDAEACHALLRERPHAFSRTSNLQPILREMGADGLFGAEGDAWAPQRRLVMQALNASHFRGFFPLLQAITARLHRRWRAAAALGEVVEMTDDLMRYTVDVTSTLAFGQDPNTLERDGDRIQQHLAGVFPMLMKRVMAPLPTWRWFRLPADRRLERDLAAVHRHIAEVIRVAREERARRPRAPGQAPRHVLEALLDARDAPGSTVTDETVAANVFTLLIAGEDTTAHSLAWTLPYLAAAPDLQRDLHEQARRRLGDAAVAPDLETLRGLDAFEALCTEATRLRPVVAVLPIDALQPARIGDLQVEAGTRLFFVLRPMATQERHFADPLHFRPERWTDPAWRDAHAHEPRAHNQFGAGPRVCPGRHLAGVEIRLVLSMLLRDFEFELACDPAEIEEVCAFTMGPSRMPVRLHLRDPARPAP